MVKFGSARISEDNSVNGQRGDQTSQEVSEQPAYWHRNGWGKAIRAKDPNVANGIAFVMACACRSDVVGYSQVQDGGRYLIFWTDLREDVLTNADCSTLVPFCVIKAGVNVNVDGIWTGNLRQRLLETGAFDEVAFSDLNQLCTGDILIDAKATSHTVVVTEGNSRDWRPTFDVPEPTLCWGSRGSEVRKLQAFFNEYGDGCGVDGIFGQETYGKVSFFQAITGLTVDGIYGQKTHDMVCFLLFLNGVQTI